MTVRESRVCLVSIDIEGFRGVNKRVHLDFGPRATVLSAWNGRGKSTLLGAIEWVLWGELRFQASENHTHDELNSLFHPAGRATVQLTLSRDGREIVVRRQKTVRKRDSSVELTDENGQTLEGAEADSYIYRLLGLSFEDFYRAAFLHQESIRGLLTEEQKDRDEAMDRLFGVERIRDLLGAIRPKPVTTALAEIEASETNLMARLAGAGGVAEDVRTRAREEALELGYAEEELTLEHGLIEAGKLQRNLKTACEKYDHSEPADLPLVALDDLDRVSRRVKTTITEIRLAVGRESPLDAALGHLGDLRRLRAEVDETTQSHTQAASEFGEHEKEHGKPQEWARESTGLATKVDTAQAALRVLDARGRVITDALEYLEASPAAKECPVCGDPKEASKLASLLRAKVQKDLASEIRRLNRQVEESTKRLNAIEDLKLARMELQQAVETAARIKDETRDRAWHAMGRDGTAGDVVPELERKERELEAKLEGLRTLNQTRETDLKTLGEGADRLRALQRFLKADTDFARVREKAEESEGGGAKGLEEEKARLTTLKSDIDAVIFALNGLASGRAEEALASCGDSITQTYSKLCNHPYFDGLKIELGQKAVQGVQRNTYRIVAYSKKDGQRTSASSRLSTAQMNCVALSAYLSLSKVLTHNLGFMLLDDPSQNLDGEHKRALASVLGNLLPSLQLVVGTHDAEFDAALHEQWGRDGVSWYDLAWAPREGTSLRPAAAVN